MAGIIIPGDRSTSNQARGYCLNPMCFESSDDSRFEFDINHNGMACPKCGCDTPPRVGLLVLTHLLVADSKGPIGGANGSRWRLACNAKRAYTATNSNLEAATGDRRVANCLECLQATALIQHNLIPNPIT